MTRYYVKYKVPAVKGKEEIVVGPYETLARAEEEMSDIKGYEGVEGCYVSAAISVSENQ